MGSAMKKKQIIILGAGISGLSLAYFLSKQNKWDVLVLEKNQKAGGWIKSQVSQGFLFEHGPRTFLLSKCKHILQLSQELNLEQEIVYSHPEGRGKYLWIQGSLKKVPIWTWSLIKALLKEWRVPCAPGDESVWDFACRRFNPTVAHHFFDPMVTGIYAGDIRKLSMEACFPTLKMWERTWGSITRGLWKMRGRQSSHLFTFRKGIQSLVDELEKQSSAQFHYGEEVSHIAFKGEKVFIKAAKEYEADYLFSALPCHIVGKLIDPEFLQIPLRGATVVNLGYRESVLDKNGYGYLVSSEEKEKVLGVVFDSKAFPREGEGTKLTVMLKDLNLKKEEALEIALDALSRHLNIQAWPNVYDVTYAPQAFPQMETGHITKMQTLESKLKSQYPRLRLVGNYLYGVGVEDCVARAKSVSESFFRAVES